MSIPFDSASCAAGYAKVFPDWAEFPLTTVEGEEDGTSAHS